MRVIILLVTFLALFISACQDSASTRQTTSADTTAETPPESLKVYKDPVTGEITTPPEDEIRRQNLESNTGTMDVKKTPPEETPLEGGGYRAPLGSEFQVDTRATVQPDGSIVIEEGEPQGE
jgi:hypothetical protein